jgi:hypothetical protein
MRVSEKRAEWDTDDYQESRGRRTAYGDLYAALAMTGGVDLLGHGECERIARHLASLDEAKAWRVSAHLVRGESMPPELAAWVRSAGRAVLKEQK